ncbi:hypothetical protein ACLKA7_001939 [Drosophila subpalustris]
MAEDDEVKSQDQSRDAEIMMVKPSDKPDDESSTVLQDVPASATGNSRPGEELESESIADEQCIEEGAAEEQVEVANTLIKAQSARVMVNAETTPKLRGRQMK